MTATGARKPGPVAGMAGRLLGLRPLVRAPIWLFRARMGWLVGPRFLLLEHRGRVSGLKRFVVLEVIGRTATGTYYVASGFGTHSQWYRNVMADNRVRVTVGLRGVRTARARRLSEAEAREVLSPYRSAHPRTWKTLLAVLESTLGEPVSDDGSELPLIALTVDG